MAHMLQACDALCEAPDRVRSERVIGFASQPYGRFVTKLDVELQSITTKGPTRKTIGPR
jgi:hypothetical protein